MNFSQHLANYCERTGPSFWAEPLNAWTNAAFLAAAAAAFVLWRQKGGRDGSTLFLIAVAGATSVGSFLFHTFATRWAMLADVVPIAVFIYAYFLMSLRRFFGLGLLAGLAGTAAFAAFGLGLEAIAPQRLLNGSTSYLPALLALSGVPAVLTFFAPEDAAGKRRRETARLLGIAALVFMVSLSLRTIDREICDFAPLGTHFLWHLLNGLVLYLLLRAAIHWRA